MITSPCYADRSVTLLECSSCEEGHVERTSMSDRDLMRAVVVDRMVRRELTSAEGAELLALSVRQAKRLRKRFVASGRRAWSTGICRSAPTMRVRGRSELG